jgi:LPS O-antigen subunit length determinant protein (WzzB/FepE family)
MKKSNTYLAGDEINLGDFIKSLWREKILILFISIICGLLGFLYASFQTQEFRTEFLIKKPSSQIFESYIPQDSSNKIVEKFIYDFTLNFLSLENLQIFIEESKEFDNLKKYLKSKNISAAEYFRNRISEVKENRVIIPNKYFLVLTKELDGNIFLNNYAEFTKEKTILETKKNLKLTIINTINIHENAYEKAKLINLENPVQRSLNEYILVARPDDIFYKGTRILSKEIIDLKKLLIKLEDEQFNFKVISNQQPFYIFKIKPYHTYFVTGLVIGVFLSLGIIFFKNILKNN